MGEFTGSGKAFLTESGEGRASGDVRGSGGGGQVPGPAPHQPPPGASFPRNFRKHLRMVGSRRVKAQTFAERRERSFSRSWSDPTPMKADTSHDSRDSRCPVQASPSLPEAPLGPQAPGTAGRAPRRRPSFCASALRPSVCRSGQTEAPGASDLVGRVNEQRPRAWARAPAGLCSLRGPRSCSRRPERQGAQLLLGAPRRAPLAGADTCTLAPTGLAPGSTRLPSQTASGWWQRPGLPGRW